MTDEERQVLINKGYTAEATSEDWGKLMNEAATNMNDTVAHIFGNEFEQNRIKTEFVGYVNTFVEWCYTYKILL